MTVLLFIISIYLLHAMNLEFKVGLWLVYLAINQEVRATIETEWLKSPTQLLWDDPPINSD